MGMLCKTVSKALLKQQQSPWYLLHPQGIFPSNHPKKGLSAMCLLFDSAGYLLEMEVLTQAGFARMNKI